MGKNLKQAQQYDSEFRKKAIQLAISSAKPIALNCSRTGDKETHIVSMGE